MKYHNKFDAEDLLRRIGQIRQQAKNRLAMFVSLSQLTSVQPWRAVDMLVGQLRATPYADTLEAYLLPNHDIVIIVLSGAEPAALLSYICHIFADDPLAQTPRGANGNALCSVYRTTEELLEFHTRLIGVLNAKKQMIAEQQDNGVLNPEQFNLAVGERKRRQRPFVLVVEDQRFSRQMVVQVLGPHFNILEAEGGIEALKLYETHAPDIVFLDIDLPGIDGYEVLKRICALDNDTFVVMLTASNTAKNVQDALRSGAQGYIVKPFTKQKIGQYLNLFHQRHPERGVRAS